jgi:putative endopeptidase
VSTDSYFANILRSNQFDLAYMLNKVDKPTDVNEWLMTPQTVNAYYQPTTNEICFPAAILQPPFFNQQADDATNYGAIGVVIGHEMTHGFDDEGRQYDLTGNLKDWWQPEDSKKFDARAGVLADYFSNIEVVPGTKANGKLTLGENLADNGGLHISYVAMLNAMKKGDINADKMDGFTPAQRFFLGYATVWASNIREQEMLRLTKLDPHSLAKWRVDGTLPHIDMFLEAFGVKPGDKMYLPKEKQALIW